MLLVAGAFVSLLVGLLAGACSVPNLDETGKACTSGVACPGGLPCVNGRCGGSAPSGCTNPPPKGGDPCTAIPALSGTQVVDCMPTEFCNVPVLSFDADGGPGLPAVPVSVQVAWSDAGLHVFATVTKWPVIPQTDVDSLYAGDAVEIFVAASSADLQGKQGDDSVHLIAAPPATNVAGGAAVFFQTNQGKGVYTVTQGTFMGCLNPDAGYSMELQIPWQLPWLADADAPQGPPVAGQKMGFDFSVDVWPPSLEAQVQSWEFIGPPPTTGATSECILQQIPGGVWPFCDDRCWCTPTAE
jgi:hypothetical protein